MFSRELFILRFIFLTCRDFAVAQWSERLPFTSVVAGPILSKNVLNVTRTHCSAHVKRVSQHSRVVGLLRAVRPVSSHREVDRVG